MKFAMPFIAGFTALAFATSAFAFTSTPRVNVQTTQTHLLVSGEKLTPEQKMAKKAAKKKVEKSGKKKKDKATKGNKKADKQKAKMNNKKQPKDELQKL